MTTLEASRVPSPSFWRDRRVLVTGHTGFKGSWLTTWLTSLGATTAGISLPDLPSSPALWEELELRIAADIRCDVAGDGWQAAATAFDPQIVIHLAAQPLVAQGYTDPLGTFETNVLGTAKVLAATAHFASLEAVLVATTDKVYDTAGEGPYIESTPLNGIDPYAASKVGTELVVRSWPGLQVPTVTARAGNVIGGGDWARDRLVPDLIRSWSAGDVAELRRPEAVRPWQHVMEPLGGYLVYLEQLAEDPHLPRSLNFGPSDQQAVSVRELAEHAANTWQLTLGEPPPGVRIADAPTIHETHHLEIDSSLAGQELNWRSTLEWRAAVELTIDWYASRTKGAPADELVRNQLLAFTKAVAQ